MSADTRAGTAAGFAAILLWSALARLTVWAGPLPPFELVAITFAVGAAAGMAAAAVRGRPVLGAARAAPGATLLATAGLFGYHALYFAALAAAPPAEASLVAYLWPLLIVLLAGLLPGERLSPRHGAGALLGFAGAGLLIAAGGGAPGAAGWSPRTGHVLALCCAVVWAGYSVLNRRFRDAPPETVVAAAAATAVLALAVHLAVERTAVPAGGALLAVAALGLGPVGVAFVLWDHGTKHGDLRLLGVLSYLAPLLSTAILVATGAAPATAALGLATALIAGGAALAALPGTGRRLFRGPSGGVCVAPRLPRRRRRA